MEGKEFHNISSSAAEFDSVALFMVSKDFSSNFLFIASIDKLVVFIECVSAGYFAIAQFVLRFRVPVFA